MRLQIIKQHLSGFASVISLLTLLLCLLFPGDTRQTTASSAPIVVSQSAPVSSNETSTAPVTQKISTAASTTAAAPVKTQVVTPKPIPQCQSIASGINTVVIADICLNAPLQRVGVTATGEIDTPVSNIGLWGAEPGSAGTSLLDGHVFGVFARLSNLQPGAHISVNSNGNISSYRVVSSETIALDQLYLNGKWDNILNPNDGVSHLTFITCAGRPLGGAQYSHRLFVYALPA